MGDETFAKYFVCTHMHMNPYSDETKRVPDIYWITQLMFIKVRMKQDWKYFWEPQGELIGSIAEPSVYQEYIKAKKSASKEETAEDAMKNPTGSIGITSAETNTHYDPEKGLINEFGEVLIPKEEFDEHSNIGGVAISY